MACHLGGIVHSRTEKMLSWRGDAVIRDETWLRSVKGAPCPAISELGLYLETQ